MARTNVGFHLGSTHDRPTIGLTIYTQLGSLGLVSNDPKNAAQTLAHSAKRLGFPEPLGDDTRGGRGQRLSTNTTTTTYHERG
ncbi:hypothetical protein V6N13_108874 [Hibiscus sabdariffa]|uniref:Uncharacterized protein n=1 Tax=Hibiscus sabdariffa TaxID=183260 RepID=A0ABR2FNI4_9ROSI